MITSILSLFLIVIFLTITIVVLVPIFKTQKMKINETSVPLSYQRGQTFVTCDSCITLTLEDTINMIDGFQYVMYEKNDTLANCDSQKYEFFFKA